MLFMVGPGLQAELGWGAFAALYLLSGAAANAASYVGNVALRRRRLWRTAGASAAVYALLACTALVQPYRRFVWLFGIELHSLGCAPLLRLPGPGCQGVPGAGIRRVGL